MRHFDTKSWQLSRWRVRGHESGVEHKDKPSLLFIHGLGGDLDEFHLIWPSISKNRHVMVYDQPGYGPLIDHPHGLSVEELADAAADVLRSRANGPADIVGTSMGTMVTLALATRHPELVRSAALLAPAGVWDWEPQFAGFLKSLAPLVATPPGKAIYLLYSLLSQANENAPPGWSRLDWLRWEIWRHSTQDYFGRGANVLQTMHKLVRTDCEPFAEAMDKPLLIVCGDADAPHSIRASKRYHELVPGSRLEWIPGGTHLIWMGNHDSLGPMLDGFFSENP